MRDMMREKSYKDKHRHKKKKTGKENENNRHVKYNEKDKRE